MVGRREAHLAALLGVLLIIASVEHALFWLTAPPREIHLARNFKQPAYQAGRVVPPTCLYTDPRRAGPRGFQARP